MRLMIVKENMAMTEINKRSDVRVITSNSKNAPCTMKDNNKKKNQTSRSYPKLVPTTISSMLTITQFRTYSLVSDFLGFTQSTYKKKKNQYHTKQKEKGKAFYVLDKTA